MPLVPILTPAGIEMRMKPEPTPVTHCPFCGADEVSVYLIDWKAQSLEPSDPDNTAVLWEHQCNGCCRSFWTADKP